MLVKDFDFRWLSRWITRNSLIVFFVIQGGLTWANGQTPRGQTSVTPSQFVFSQAQKVLVELKSHPLSISMPFSEPVALSVAPSKGAWLNALYDRQMILASWATKMLADKRLVYEVLQIELGSRAQYYYPKTMGLREFLLKNRLINARGELTAGGDKIDEALHREFPSGVIVRPAVGVVPNETSHGLFKSSDELIVSLLDPKQKLYSSDHYRHPVKSHILNAIASGEAVVLQADFLQESHLKRPLHQFFFDEVRVHTYESRVVEGAIPQRWVQKNRLSQQKIIEAQEFVNDFLRSLPLAVTNRQAWGVDVAVMDNGEMKIVDIVTNRGKRTSWSSYLTQPRVIGAYSRHMEQIRRLRFDGFSGTLIRSNLANYLPYWNTRIQKAKPGWKTLLALLPPTP